MVSFETAALLLRCAEDDSDEGLVKEEEMESGQDLRYNL